MAASVNLMTPRARHAAATDRILRGWSWAAVATFVLLSILATWTWRQRRELVLTHDALEASYEPMRRLAADNRTLRAAASDLVSRDAIELGLSNHRPVVALLASISRAIAASEGAVYAESMLLAHDAATAAEAPATGKLTLNVVSMLGYDVSRLVKQLDAPPFTMVKVTSSETVANGDTPRKKHVLHCEF